MHTEYFLLNFSKLMKCTKVMKLNHNLLSVVQFSNMTKENNFWVIAGALY